MKIRLACLTEPYLHLQVKVTRIGYVNSCRKVKFEILLKSTIVYKMNFIRPGSKPIKMFDEALVNGYAMREAVIDPSFCAEVSEELDIAGELYDYNEMNPVNQLGEMGMDKTLKLRGTLAAYLQMVDKDHFDLLSLYSVRVFPAGEYATTVHRNHQSVRPWAVGVTLKGESTFSVYDQDVLPEDSVFPLLGDEYDPKPKASMKAGAGAVWVLYTQEEQVPHSGGLVNSTDERELLIFYDLNF